MKKFKIAYIFLFLIAVSCQQEPVAPTEPEVVTPPDPCGENPSAGSANFSKFVAIGNSLTAGFQAGALYNEGQQNSLPKIMAKQFECTGGSTTFNQPDINSVNGYNSTFSNPGAGVILGRLILFDAGTGRGPLPTPAGAPGVPSPYNTADLPTPYTGNKTTLNNFSVPGILLGQALTPLTGGPATANPAYNALYARFASNPGTSTIMSDALTAQGTFYLFWLGDNDVLGYAVTGGSGAVPITSESDFSNQYNGAINAMLSANASIKGVVGNIPLVTNLPYFTTVKWNNIAFDAAKPVDVGTVALLNSNFGGFNAALDGLAGAGLITAAEAAKRKVTYKTGSNAVLINDEESENLGPKFDILVGAGAITPAQRAALSPFVQARPMTATELVTFPAATVLGTLAVPSDPTTVYGVAVPMPDQYILTENEINRIKSSTTAFNATIAAAVTASSNRLALADVNVAYTALLTAGADVKNGVTVTPGFAPPTGIFSEDGVHPNSRGYAYTANIFINAINAKFGAAVPLANIANYSATGLPKP
jgi:hypothetical protein